MMQKIFLLLNNEGTTTFDASRLREILRRLPHVTICREGHDPSTSNTLLECELRTDNDKDVPVTIEVPTDLRHLTIGAYSNVGLEAAINIQREYGDEIYAFSEESLPDSVQLSTVSTA